MGEGLEALRINLTLATCSLLHPPAKARKLPLEHVFIIVVIWMAGLPGTPLIRPILISNFLLRLAAHAQIIVILRALLFSPFYD